MVKWRQKWRAREREINETRGKEIEEGSLRKEWEKNRKGEVGKRKGRDVRKVNAPDLTHGSRVTYKGRSKGYNSSLCIYVKWSFSIVIAILYLR